MPRWKFLWTGWRVRGGGEAGWEVVSCTDFLDLVVMMIVTGLLLGSFAATLIRFARLDLRGRLEDVDLMFCIFWLEHLASHRSQRSYTCLS